MHLYIHPPILFKRSKSTSQVNFYSDNNITVSLLTLKTSKQTLELLTDSMQHSTR